MKKLLRKLMLLCVSSLLIIPLVNTAAMAGKVAAIGAGDMKIKSGSVQIDYFKASTAFISEKFQGGTWGDDGSYTWKNGQAEFNQGGDMVKLALMNNFTTSRGITCGAPVAKLLAAYPAGYQMEKTSDGPVYLYNVKINGMDCSVGFAVSGKTKKVIYALIAADQPAEETQEVSGDTEVSLKNSIGAYDGFLWSGTDQAEQLKVCKALAIQFNKAGYPDFMGDEGEQKLWWVITKFYQDNGSDHGQFQEGLINIAIQKFKIKDKNVVNKVRGE